MLTLVCKAPPHNNLALLSDLGSAPALQSAQPSAVSSQAVSPQVTLPQVEPSKKVTRNTALLQDLISQQSAVVQPPAATPVTKTDQNKEILQNFFQQQQDIEAQAVPIVKPEHSKGQISLYLANLQSARQAPSPKKTDHNNELLLQNFMQKLQSPLYQKAMSILSNKKLQIEYRQSMNSIQLFFMDYSIQELQTFHVHTSVPPRNISSWLDNLSTAAQVPVAPKVVVRNNLQALLPQEIPQEDVSAQVQKAPKNPHRNNLAMLSSLQSQG